MGTEPHREPERDRESIADPMYHESESHLSHPPQGRHNLYHGRLNSEDMDSVHKLFYEVINERDWKTPVHPTEFDWVYLDADNQVIQARIETPPYGGRSTIHLHPYAFSWDDRMLLKGLIHHELVHWVVGPHNAHNHIFDAEEQGWTSFESYKEQTKLFSAHLNEADGEYFLTCKNCNRTVRRNRRPSPHSACRKCCIEFNNGNWSQDYTFHIGGDSVIGS